MTRHYYKFLNTVDPPSPVCIISDNIPARNALQSLLDTPKEVESKSITDPVFPSEEAGPTSFDKNVSRFALNPDVSS